MGSEDNKNKDKREAVSGEKYSRRKSHTMKKTKPVCKSSAEESEEDDSEEGSANIKKKEKKGIKVEAASGEKYSRKKSYKNKKNKKISKSSEEESEEDDSEEESSANKKKEKKVKRHKKHKKNKKHKKHKKYREVSSREDENLEKKLRERALNSMKKKEAKGGESDGESSSE